MKTRISIIILELIAQQQTQEVMREWVMENELVHVEDIIKAFRAFIEENKNDINSLQEFYIMAIDDAGTNSKKDAINYILQGYLV